MSKSTTDLCTIARAGGSIKISSNKSTTDLCTIARALSNGAKLTVKDASNKSTTDLCIIARANSGNVLFDFN